MDYYVTYLMFKTGTNNIGFISGEILKTVSNTDTISHKTIRTINRVLFTEI